MDRRANEFLRLWHLREWTLKRLLEGKGSYSLYKRGVRGEVSGQPKQALPVNLLKVLSHSASQSIRSDTKRDRDVDLLSWLTWTEKQWVRLMDPLLVTQCIIHIERELTANKKLVVEGQMWCVPGRTPALVHFNVVHLLSSELILRGWRCLKSHTAILYLQDQTLATAASWHSGA